MPPGGGGGGVGGGGGGGGVSNEMTPLVQVLVSPPRIRSSSTVRSFQCTNDKFVSAL